MLVRVVRFRPIFAALLLPASSSRARRLPFATMLPQCGQFVVVLKRRLSNPGPIDICPNQGGPPLPDRQCIPELPVHHNRFATIAEEVGRLPARHQYHLQQPLRLPMGSVPGQPEQPRAEEDEAPAGSRSASPETTLERLGTLQTPSTRSNIHVLTVVGQIEGHLTLPPQNKTTKYEHLIPQIVAIELNPDIRGLLVVLNTVGGDVEAGLALAEMVASLSKPTVSLILGGGHSIGIPVAVAADYSLIAPTATMTIHPIRLSGLVVGVPQTYEYLDKMQDRVVRFIVGNSRISEARLRELMFRTGELARDIGTVLVGEDAVREGLIDAVGGVGKAVAWLEEMAQGLRPRKGVKSDDTAVGAAPGTGAGGTGAGGPSPAGAEDPPGPGGGRRR